MSSRDFCFWLQGFLELNKPKSLTEEQTKLVAAHLNLVFKHEIDPSIGDQEHQDSLNQIHHPSPGHSPSPPVYRC